MSDRGVSFDSDELMHLALRATNQDEVDRAIGYLKELLAAEQQGERVASGIKASYYLEESDILDLDDFQNLEQFAELGVPVWIVYRAESARTVDKFPWLQSAELKEKFDRRIEEPFSSVRVYYLNPDRLQDHSG